MRVLKSRFSNLVGVLLLGTVLIIAITCSKPFEPAGVKDYVLYAYNGAASFEYYEYHTKSGLFDTFNIPEDASDPVLNESPLAVSPNGQILYLATESGNVSLVDVQRKQVIQQLPYFASSVVVSKNGKYLAVHGWRHELWILETESFSEVYFDSSSYSGHFRIGRFAESNKTYYCTDDIDTASLVYKIDFLSDSIPEIKQMPAVEVIPSHDESRWYLYLYHGNSIFEFRVVSLVNDSIIFSDVFSPGSGWMEISPDGRYVFYTYPGGMIGPSPTRKSISVYDTYSNEIVKLIPGDFIDSLGDTSTFYYPAELAITPDGRNLIAMQRDGVGNFLVINVPKLEVEKYVQTNVIQMAYLAIQGRP
jgi:DNA-binding beta-propeller fold protein YncE